MVIFQYTALATASARLRTCPSYPRPSSTPTSWFSALSTTNATWFPMLRGRSPTTTTPALVVSTRNPVPFASCRLSAKPPKAAWPACATGHLSTNGTSRSTPTTHSSSRILHNTRTIPCSRATSRAAAVKVFFTFKGGEGGKGNEEG